MQKFQTTQQSTQQTNIFYMPQLTKQENEQYDLRFSIPQLQLAAFQNLCHPASENPMALHLPVLYSIHYLPFRRFRKQPSRLLTTKAKILVTTPKNTSNRSRSEILACEQLTGNDQARWWKGADWSVQNYPTLIGREDNGPHLMFWNDDYVNVKVYFSALFGEIRVKSGFVD